MRARVTRGAAAACALVALFLVIRLLPDAAPEADFAVIDLRVFDAFRHFDPAGAYSRYGWSHPGPLYFQLLAPFAALGGARHLAVLAGAALINVACLAGLMAVLQRHAASGALVIASTVAFGAYFWRTFGLLASPWNPHAGIVPLACLAVALAAASSGTPRLWPVAAFLASLVVQAHVGFAPAAAAMVLTGLAAGIAARDARPGGRVIAATAVVLGVVWALPLVDELRPAGAHNLRAVVEFLGAQMPMPPRTATLLFSRFFVAPFAPDLHLPFGDVLSSAGPVWTWPVAIGLLALVVAAGAIEWTRGRRFEAHLAMVTLAGSLAALWSVHRLPDSPNDHAIFWVSVLGVLGWSIASASVIDLVRGARPGARGQPTGGLYLWLGRLVVAAAIVLAAVQVMAFNAEAAAGSARPREAARLVAARLAAAHVDAPLVHVPQALWSQTAGVVLQLRRAGFAPAVDADWVLMFGRAYRPTGREPLAVQLADAREDGVDLRHRANAELLGSIDGTFVYVIDPPPPTVAGPVNVSSTTGDVRSAERLGDGSFRPGLGDMRSPDAVVFVGPQTTVTVSLAAAAIGVRLWGESATRWRLACASTGRTIGRIDLPAGPGSQSADAYPRELPDCAAVSIGPDVDGRAVWLSEIQALAPRR